jgi:hypothetical protein
MNRLLSVVAAGMLSAVTIHTHAGAPGATIVSPPLIIVEDRGGASALPYYQALNPQDAEANNAAVPVPRIGSRADAEATMLPVRSARLSPGDEPRRVIRAPGLTPLFLVGADDRSRAWLTQRRAALHLGIRHYPVLITATGIEP